VESQSCRIRLLRTLSRYRDQEYRHRKAYHLRDHVKASSVRFLQIAHHPGQQLPCEHFWIRERLSVLPNSQLSEYCSQLASSRVPLGNLNIGLQDQRAALEFVQVNIADFGGDREKVSLRSLCEDSLIDSDATAR